MKERYNSSSVFVFEELETRLLFSADGAEALVTDAGELQPIPEEPAIDGDLALSSEGDVAAEVQIVPNETDLSENPPATAPDTTSEQNLQQTTDDTSDEPITITT